MFNVEELITVVKANTAVLRQLLALIADLNDNVKKLNESTKKTDDA